MNPVILAAITVVILVAYLLAVGALLLVHARDIRRERAALQEESPASHLTAVGETRVILGSRPSPIFTPATPRLEEPVSLAAWRQARGR